MAELDDSWKTLDRECRFGLFACGIGLVLAYALVFPLKLAGLMPGHLSWLGLAIAPAAILGLLGSLFAGVLLLRRRWICLFLPMAVLSGTAMMTLIWWERGW